MYESFYQLTTNPFRLAPDPNFCFSHSGYKRAREYLEYALDQGEGFVMVTGRPGTGKTLLLETFLTAIDTSTVVARRIAVSNYAGDDLLRAVAYAYDIDAAEMDKATLRHRIHQYFIKQEQAGRRVLLIIDEAQALQHTALEELRILADLQTQSRLMLQLFLVGQESLQELMHAPDMEQFQQRVIANYHLVPLSLSDTRAYIEHRLLQAGWDGDPEYTGAAVLSVFQLSKGVPRHINKICNRLLLLGFGKGRHLLDKEDVQTISVEMREEQLTPVEANRARFTDAESISSIPEIQDGLFTIADLAIRADNVDASLPAISEAYRLGVMNKEQFIDRRHDDPAVWNVQHSSSADPVIERSLIRFTWRETFVGMAAMLAITTISIAALPSILGESADNNRLSLTDHQTLEIQDASGAELPGSSGDELTADEIVVTVTTDLAETRALERDAYEDEVIPDTQEDDVLVATSGMPDTAMPEETSAVPVVTAHVRWTDNPEDTQQLEHEPQVAVAEMPAQTETVAGYRSLSADLIERTLLPEEEQQGAVAGPVHTVPVAETVAPTHDETIKQLLSKGQQSLDAFRLLTPEEGNAYGYYRAVLLLDPANEDAYQGILRIVDRYIMLVRKATYQNENDRAKRYVKRGLSIDPANRELLALQDSIDRALQGALASTVTVAPGEPASQETVSAVESSTQDSLIEGIRTFFKKRQAEARRGIVSIPAGWDG